MESSILVMEPEMDYVDGENTVSSAGSPNHSQNGQRLKRPGQTLKTQGASKSLSFHDSYSVQRRISKGSFGTVYVTEHNETKEEYAVKVIDRRKLNDRESRGVLREVSIMRACRDVENVVRLVDFFQSNNYFFVVQVFARGGDVLTRLASKETYTEKDARDLAIHLLRAVDVIHSRNLAHRDLKPENLLLRDMMDDSAILVADFGFAAYVPEDGLKTRCGTPAFVAPEVLVQNCRYDQRCDCWSVGTLLYLLLGGYPPFQDTSSRGLFRKIRGADFVFHDAYWKNVSISAKQLISSFLTVEPKYRCTAKMALEKSNWLKLSENALKAIDLSASLGEIKKFQAKQFLKGAVHAIIFTRKNKFKSADDKTFSTRGFDKDGDQSKVFTDNDLLRRVGPTPNFSDVYELRSRVYTSQSASIWECFNKYRGEIFVVKVIQRDNEDSRKSSSGRTMAEKVLHEVAILDSLKHKNIIRVIDFFEEEKNFYVVLERMDGGDLFDRLMRRKNYTEKIARDFANGLLEAVKYIHSEGIAHRDLKPQNILLQSPSDDADIKIADFGFACRVHTPQSLTTRCGTPTYVAPEILKNVPYDQSCDMWSIGVILYILLCGYPPFLDENQSILFQKIRIGEWGFNANDWCGVSEDAKDLIRNLLVVNPLRRWTAQQALRCKWLCEEDRNLECKDLSQSLEIMKRRRSKLLNMTKTMIWVSKKGGVSNTMNAMEALLARPETNQGNGVTILPNNRRHSSPNDLNSHHDFRKQDKLEEYRNKAKSLYFI